MGSGALKTLLSNKVSKNQFLYVVSCGSYSPEPCIGLLLRCLRMSGNDFFVDYASVVDDCFSPLAWAWDPIRLVASWGIPRMLGTIATQMSLFMTGVTLNFSYISL